MRARVEIGRHAIVGAGSVIFPGVDIGGGIIDRLMDSDYKVDRAVVRTFDIPAKKD